MSTTHSDPTPQPAPVEWHAAPPVAPDQTAVPATPGKHRGRIAAGVAALLIAVGGTTGYLVGHGSSGGTTSAASAPQGAPAGAGGGLGFQPTSYHLDGTITAIGRGTVTIRTSSGTTATYTVTSDTHLVADGSTATLSSFTVGESVRASTTTQGGTTLNDMVSGDLDGTPPQGTTTG
jgi:hypothetical protein